MCRYIHTYVSQLCPLRGLCGTRVPSTKSWLLSTILTERSEFLRKIAYSKIGIQKAENECRTSFWTGSKEMLKE